MPPAKHPELNRQGLPRQRAPKKTARQKAKTIAVEERATKTLELAHAGVKTKDIAAQFGVSLSLVQHDLKKSLTRWQQSRLAMAALVFDDHLLALDTLIAQLADRLFILNGLGEPTTTLNLDVVKEYRACLQERAKLLDLYPKHEPQPNGPVINNYTLNFGNAPLPAADRADVIDGHAQPVLSFDHRISADDDPL